jgi:hypothetical protein
MKRVGLWARGLAVSLCLGASWGALADGDAASSCEREASAVRSETVRHFLVLAASRGVFHDQSGPSLVMLMRTDAVAGESDMGAVGIYADDKGRAVFGSVPWQAYDAFLREPAKGSQHVLLRLEISDPQYERVLGILRTWEKRARLNELLYPEHVFMNNILLVKQATEELNRCRESVNLYKLDWSLEDRISDDNATSRVPLLVFEELKRRNASLHVADSKMPEALLRLAGTTPLSAREPPPAQEAAVRAPAPTHEHHAHGHHAHEPTAPAR